jgi:hypothetical protein
MSLCYRFCQNGGGTNIKCLSWLLRIESCGTVCTAELREVGSQTLKSIITVEGGEEEGADLKTY